MEIVLVLIMIAAAACQSGFCSMFGRFYPGSSARSPRIFSIFYGLIVAVVTFAVAGFSFDPSPTTWILGTVTGFALVAYNTFLLMAAERGSYSIVMIFNLSGGILIPLFYSVLVTGNRLSIPQIIAIAAMLAAFLLINREPKKEIGQDKKTKDSAVFLLLSVLLGLSNGAYGTLMNRQQELMESGENEEMIIITYGVSALAAFVMLLFQTKGRCVPDFKQTPKSALFMVLAAICAAISINMMMHILSLINVAVLYTLDNGGALLISVLWSVIFYKEKLNPTKIIGLILAAASFVTLGALN